MSCLRLNQHFHRDAVLFAAHCRLLRTHFHVLGIEKTEEKKYHRQYIQYANRLFVSRSPLLLSVVNNPFVVRVHFFFYIFVFNFLVANNNNQTCPEYIFFVSFFNNCDETATVAELHASQHYIYGLHMDS